MYSQFMMHSQKNIKFPREVFLESSWWPVDRPPGTLIESDGAICCMYTTISSWRWALDARNM